MEYYAGCAMIDNRPVYLNLLKIKLPLTGIVSFAHRITGVILFFSLPFAVYLFDLSLESEHSFIQAQHLLNQPLVLSVQVLLIVSLTHHFFAGIRFLLIDAEIGVEKSQAIFGAWVVIFVEIISIIGIIYGVIW